MSDRKKKVHLPPPFKKSDSGPGGKSVPKPSDFMRVKALYEAATGRKYRVPKQRFAARSSESDTIMDEATEIISLLGEEEFHSFLEKLIYSEKTRSGLCLEVVAFFHDRTIRGFDQEGPIGLFTATISHMISSYHEGDRTYQFDSGSKTYSKADLEALERIHNMITQSSSSFN